MTAVVSTVIFLLVLVSGPYRQQLKTTLLILQNDLGEFLYGAPDYSFTVDQTIEKDLQLNVDLTVAMPCHCELQERWTQS